MPELPEVETMRRGIAHLKGRRIVAAAFPHGVVRPIATTPRPTVITARLRGGTIASVQRFGKRVAIAIDAAAGRRWLVIEPRMTGLLLVSPPPTVEHVRLVLTCDRPRRKATAGRPCQLLFWDQRGLGTIRLVDAAGLQRICGAEKLGPDGLAIEADQLASALGRSRRAIKVALLDQRAVAGIGNIYAAEILHRAGIDPRMSCRRLPKQAWQSIATVARRVLAEAVRLEGSSIGDELYRTPESRLGRFQRRHRVYGRAGKPCRACGDPIQRIVQAQRSTFFCPRCQRCSGAMHG